MFFNVIKKQYILILIQCISQLKYTNNALFHIELTFLNYEIIRLGLLTG